MQNRLIGKTVLITGASSGIGEATAREFARMGANLILTARRVDRLEILKEELLATENIKIFVIGMDVTNPKQVATALSHLPQQIDTIDILAVLRLISAKMVAQGSGHIINIGSVAGIESYAKGGVYCATKHAVHAITQALREEMVEHGIRVSEILPGAVNTEFSTIRFNGDKQRADAVYQGFEPLKASDVAELIIYNANLPAHVNLAECLILAGRQSRATKIHRQS